MQLCYVDESGTAETLTEADRDQQPAIVIAGVSLPERDLLDITHRWLELKARFYPSAASRARGGWLDVILHNLKGTTIRNGFKTRATTRQKRNAVGFLDGMLKLLESYDAKIIGRMWIKELDVENEDMSMHGAGLQHICAAFDAMLPKAERGMVVVDSQTYRHNHQLAHSMFTQRFGKTPRHCGLVDMPVFGHSDNHAGLQIADMICSALLAPLAAAVYAGPYKSWNRHCDRGFIDIREEFGQRIAARTFTWKDYHGQDVPSLTLSNPVSKRGIKLMWSPETKPRRKPSPKAQPRTTPRRRTHNRAGRSGRSAPGSK
ncbi:MAG TPA: DUF3800 domain-containing protein [Solirubrobacteraceae bacterium]|nr:DUF3800 domain-containing protein [Solirubrobacteraceae bacterium]